MQARSANWKPDLTRVILTLVGLTGLVLFILACRPSWSPDGRKVLYSYWDDGAGKAAVAVFDRKTRSSHLIFEWGNEESSNQTLAGAQWTKDGEEAIVTTYVEEAVQIVVVSVTTQRPLQMYALKKMGDLSVLPIPQVGNQLFVVGGKAWVRLNLTTGEVLRREDKEVEDGLLYDVGGKVFYIRQIEEKAEETKKEVGEKKTLETPRKNYEFGELDQKDLSLHPTLTLRSEELESKGIRELTGFADVDPGSLKTAITTDATEGKPARIVVIGKSGVEQILEVGTKEKPFKLGNPQWSRDGKMIFVSAVIEGEKTKRAEFGVVEVPVDGKVSRFDRIEEGPKEDFDEDFLTFAQIVLSPDGKLIAVTNGHVDTLPDKKGLFLLDVSRPQRPVNFYPAPALPAVSKAKKE